MVNMFKLNNMFETTTAAVLGAVIGLPPGILLALSDTSSDLRWNCDYLNRRR